VENPEVIVPSNRSRESLDDLPALISVPQAAEILGLKRATAYRYAALGNCRSGASPAAAYMSSRRSFAN
jgi:predicted DNA-binding transcriptional regulator AlpA